MPEPGLWMAFGIDASQKWMAVALLTLSGLTLKDNEEGNILSWISASVLALYLGAWKIKDYKIGDNEFCSRDM